MAVIFKPHHHEYISKEEDNIQWTSVTTLVGQFKPYFDAPAVALRVSKNKRSKWYGMEPLEIGQAWQDEAARATDLGKWYHYKQENEICSQTHIEREGILLPVVKPQVLPNGDKYAQEQKLAPGIYPEHLVYLKSVGICGQSDMVEVISNKVNICDYKTNKEIKTEGFRGYEGIPAKMLQPVYHLDDCHLVHYSLQLSLYMYMILKHNPRLYPDG